MNKIRVYDALRACDKEEVVNVCWNWMLEFSEKGEEERKALKGNLIVSYDELLKLKLDEKLSSDYILAVDKFDVDLSDIVFEDINPLLLPIIKEKDLILLERNELLSYIPLKKIGDPKEIDLSLLPTMYSVMGMDRETAMAINVIYEGEDDLVITLAQLLYELTWFGYTNKEYRDNMDNFAKDLNETEEEVNNNPDSVKNLDDLEEILSNAEDDEDREFESNLKKIREIREKLNKNREKDGSMIYLSNYVEDKLFVDNYNFFVEKLNSIGGLI